MQITFKAGSSTFSLHVESMTCTQTNPAKGSRSFAVAQFGTNTATRGYVPHDIIEGGQVMMVVEYDPKRAERRFDLLLTSSPAAGVAYVAGEEQPPEDRMAAGCIIPELKEVLICLGINPDEGDQ